MKNTRVLSRSPLASKLVSTRSTMSSTENRVRNWFVRVLCPHAHPLFWAWMKGGLSDRSDSFTAGLQVQAGTAALAYFSSAVNGEWGLGGAR
jgi:hypothetical protein